MDSTNEVPLLQIKNLYVGFSKSQGYSYAVNGVTLDIASGKVCALVGESGGGKTLISLSIMQLLPNNAKVLGNSQILFHGQDLLDLPEIAMRKIRGRRIAMIFQEPMTSFNPVLSIGQQINEVLQLHLNLSGSAKQQRCLELLAAVGIDNPKRCYQQYPHQLSGGMLQRAMIAQAIATEPDLLIADEATSALDVTIQAQILQLLKDLQRQTKMAMLFITHDLHVVEQIADEVAVIQQGKIVEQAIAKEFFLQPKHPYSKKLFAALPAMAKRGQWLTTTNSTINQPVLPVVSDSEKVLTVEKLQVYFPIKTGLLQRTKTWVKAVDGLSFQLRPGKTLALVGESGSGKTTTGKAIVKLLSPMVGKIIYQATDIHRLSDKALRKDIQFIFQDPFSAMNPRMRVGDIIAEGLYHLNIIPNAAQRDKYIDSLLKKVNLPIDSKWRYPHEFSGGQRQRICIARALAVSPKILICDEPTSALDVSIQAQILDLLKQLQHELQMAYLFITHNLAVVAYLADEVMVMYRGKIVESGPVEKILTAPEHPYTKELIAAAGKI